MSFLLNWLDELLNLGDPEIRTWFLVRQKHLPILITGFYLIIATVIGPALMKNRKRFELKNTLIVFNFSLVAIYISFLLYLLRGVILKNGVTFDEICHGLVIKKGHITYNMARACWIIYLLKYVEYLDTVFFILRKKQNQVTFLHVVHHALVPICTWLCMRTERSGMALIPGIINALVHVIMYSYYGLSAFGPEVRKYLWWKKYLTQLQMAQFLLVIFFALVVAPLSGCKMVITSYIIQFTLAPLFLGLFYSYYRKSFLLKRSTTAVNQSKETLHHELQKTEALRVSKNSTLKHEISKKLE